MSEKKIRRILNEQGYSLHKGYVHYMVNNSLAYDDNGNKISGYMVFNHRTGCYEWDCYDCNYDHLWSLEDVESFVKSIA